jgi:hypothetical protein
MRLYPGGGGLWNIKLETQDGGGQWVLAHHMRLALPRLAEWLENAEIGVGVASAELADVRVSLFRPGTIFIVK